MVSAAGETPDGAPHEEPSAQALGTPGVSGGWDDGRKETSWPSVMGRMLGDDSWHMSPLGPASPHLSHGVPPRPFLQHIWRLEGAPPANHRRTEGFRPRGWGPATLCSERTALKVSASEVCSGHSASGRVDSPPRLHDRWGGLGVGLCVGTPRTPRQGGRHSGEPSASRSRCADTGGSLWEERGPGQCGDAAQVMGREPSRLGGYQSLQ